MMDWIDVDNFAGGGGASSGIVAALGKPVDIAINHSKPAIAMHAANHPETRHYCEDIWKVDPREACRGKRVRLAWFSPDCTHFSKAKGAQPRSKEIRGLAGVVIEWAKAVRPLVIVLENVEEFEGWGPVDENGKPIKELAGTDFRAWLGELTALGYKVEWRSLVAADYGTPTTRKRLVLVARCDGQPIVWPEPTHGKGRGRPWRTAAEVIDWSIPCPSIFDRKRELKPATLRRIAAGLQRYVIGAARPFIVPVRSHGGGGNDPRSVDLPLRTVTCTKRGEFDVVSPYLAPLTHQGGDRAHAITDPFRTITAANRGELALISPTLIQTGYGERDGQAPRVPGLHKPLGTVVAGGQKHGLVAAFLAKHYGGVVGHGVERPLGTVTTQDHHSLVTAQLALPLGDTAEASFLSKFYGTCTGSDVRAPMPTVTATGQHIAEVRAFLVKYYGADGKPGASQQELFAPLHTVTTKARFGLVTVEGQDYVITDIGMRMLEPRELFNAQGFDPDYILDPPVDGSLITKPLTKTQKIELAGNSVCKQKAEAVVAANVPFRQAVAA